MLLGSRLLITEVKLPEAVVPVVFESDTVGGLFVLLQQIPLAVIAAPPLAVIVPPDVAEL